MNKLFVDELVEKFRCNLNYVAGFDARLTPDDYQKYPADTEWKKQIFNEMWQCWRANGVEFAIADVELAWKLLWIELETGIKIRIGYYFRHKTQSLTGIIYDVDRKLSLDDPHYPGAWKVVVRYHNKDGTASARLHRTFVHLIDVFPLQQVLTETPDKQPTHKQLTLWE